MGKLLNCMKAVFLLGLNPFFAIAVDGAKDASVNLKESPIFSKLQEAETVVEVVIEVPAYYPTGPDDSKRFTGETIGNVVRVFKGNVSAGSGFKFRNPYGGSEGKGDRFIFFLNKGRSVNFHISDNLIYEDFKKIFSGSTVSFEASEKEIKRAIFDLRREVNKECRSQKRGNMSSACVMRMTYW